MRDHFSWMSGNSFLLQKNAFQIHDIDFFLGNDFFGICDAKLMPAIETGNVLDILWQVLMLGNMLSTY